MGWFFSYALIPFINWGQYVFGLIIILIAANKRFNWFNFFLKITYKSLLWTVLFFKIIYAGIETFAQYYVWSGNAFTKLFLDKNVVDFNFLRQYSGKLFWFLDNRFGYFIFYTWGRFWFEIVVSLLAACIFYLFLRALKKYKERFFEEGEAELGFLLALLVGWSNFIVFLVSVFVSIILLSIFKTIFFRGQYTSFGTPFLLAALIVLLFGNYLVSVLGLMPLRI